VADIDGVKSELQAALAAAIGSISVGFVPLFMTGLQEAGVDTVSGLLLRYLVALTVLVPLALWSLGNLSGAWRDGGRWLFLNGLILGAAQTYCYFRAVESLPTSVVITVFYCYPVFAIALDRLFYGMPVRRATVIAVTIVIVGVALASLPGFARGRLDPVGLIFAALAPLGYAAYIAIAYPHTQRVPPLASAVFIYGALALAFASVGIGLGNVTLPPVPELWLNVLFIGTFGGALQIAAFTFALPRLASTGYALIVCLEFVTVVLAGVLILGEKLSPLQWTGIILVLSGILIERLARARRAAAPSVVPARQTTAPNDSVSI
jgi:drug/metabolite transporter (DMT)-like permease